MSFWTDLFGGSSKSNPYKAAEPWMNKIPSSSEQYYKDYMQMGDTGRQGMDELSSIFHQMGLDPGAYQQQLGSSFQADPGYGWDLDQQMQAGNQAMAAGGMLGSPQHQQFSQQLASHLANQQYNNYLNNQMKIAGAGQQGMGDIASQNLQYGYNSSNQMAQNMSDYFYNRANLAASKAQDYRNRHQGFWGGVASGVANAAGSFL
jgi:hypothetical protein